MAKRNGYFQIAIKGDRPYVKLFPAVEGGEPVSVNEVREYLAKNNFAVDPTILNKIIESMTQEVEVPLEGGDGFAINESFSLKLSDDKLTCIARFYPESTGIKVGQQAAEAEIKNDLSHQGIVFGIDDSALVKYVGERHYCTDYVVANGVAPVQGTDATIEYFFNTNPSVKPTLNPDGSVDFFHLNNISACTKGMVLAKLTPEVRGKAGSTVQGTPIAPRDVKTLKLKHGSNITLSDDSLTLTSEVDGHVSLVDDKVFVSNVYEVVDVDTSTGNISYNGDVLVTGNIKTGFAVEADGNVQVNGVVEGALINSGGDVIIARGVNGMSKGTIIAKGNVVAKFVENANIQAGGYVHAEAIMHSKIKASGDVTVTGKKGFIVGGSVKSLGNVTAKTIGSEMGGDTEIEVGIDPKMKQKAEQLEKVIETSKTNISKIEPVLAAFMKKIQEKAQLTPEQINYFKKLSEQYKVEKQNLQENNEEYKALVEDIKAIPTGEASVNVSGYLYPGTKVTISDVSQTISKTVQHSKLVCDGADIRTRML